MRIEPELSVLLTLVVLGTSVFGVFEVETPWWLGVAKWSVVCGATLGLYHVCGHAALAFPAAISAAAVGHGVGGAAVCGGWGKSMDQETGRLFQEFEPGVSARSDADLPGPVVVRLARMADVDALAELSAVRECGDVSVHAAGFRRAIENGDIGRTSLILAAEVDGAAVGFGKVRYLGESRAEDGALTPEGWYLMGLLVDPRLRRHGIGLRLTEERLHWIRARSRSAYYFSNAQNLVSIALHERLGFRELSRGTRFAGVSFVGGEGVLFRVELDGSSGGVL